MESINILKILFFKFENFFLLSIQKLLISNRRKSLFFLLISDVVVAAAFVVATLVEIEIPRH